MDVACKTGTTDNEADKWLCGYTPYYTAATWYGYENTNAYSAYKETAKNLWATVMKSAHKDLKNKRFTKPSNVVTARVCRTSGKAATQECKSTYTEYFVKGTVPKACDGHVAVKLCKQTGKVATQYCPETEEKFYTAKPEKEQNAVWKVQGKDKYKVPTEECTVHTEESSKITVVNVVGKPEAEAKTALTGLMIQVIYETHSDKTDGVVIRQSLAEGTRVEKGVAIVLTVNKLNGGSSSGENTQNPDTNTNTNTGTNTNTNTGTTNNTNTNTNTNTSTNTSNPNTNASTN